MSRLGIDHGQGGEPAEQPVLPPAETALHRVPQKEKLREPEVFPDTEPTENETRRLGRGSGPEETGPNSITVRMRLAGSCAGWADRPKSGEFYEAIRTEKPDRRQRAVLRVFAQEAEWHELIAAWAERAYTLRRLVAALHRAGLAECRAARPLNKWATEPPNKAE